MILAILLASVGIQSNPELRCSSPGSVRTCTADDGTTVIERQVGDRVIRQGTSPGGETWTEYVLTEAGGTRTLGTDTSGRSWTQVCSPTLGTRGTTRTGEALYAPPERIVARPDALPPRTAEEIVDAERQAYAPCPYAAEAFDSRRAEVRRLEERERRLRDRQRRRRAR